MTRLPGDRAAPTAEQCPCCYDGAARASTGVVLGRPCVVCGGTGERPPRVGDVGCDPAACDSGEVYDGEMRPIRTGHIAVNPDGSITPFGGWPGGRPN